MFAMRSLSSAVLCSAMWVSEAAPPGYKEWSKVSALTDEFDGPELDKSKWLDYHPYYGGREPSQFLPANVQLHDGHLLLRSTLADASQEGNWVWSACVTSVSPISGHGYYEARMRTSKMSMTSSFWFQSEHNWEIDVNEAMGAPSDPDSAYYANIMHMNTHNFSAGWDHDIEHPKAYTMQGGSADEFHVYGLEWNSSAISFFLDDDLVYQVDPEDGFTEDMYLFFDTEVFSWLGLPRVEDLQDDEKNAMHVDWIRAWKETSFDFNAPEMLV